MIDAVLEVREAVDFLRFYASEARRQEHVLLVLFVERVQPFEEVEQVLAHAGGRLLQEQRVDADPHASATLR